MNLSNETLYQLLQEERQDLLIDQQKLINKKKDLAFRGNAYKKLGKEIVLIQARIKTINEKIKNIRMLTQNATQSREGILVKYLNKKLRELGQTSENIRKISEQADEQWKLLTSGASEKLSIIKNEYEKPKHNKWHTETGVYDSVAGSVIK